MRYAKLLLSILVLISMNHSINAAEVIGDYFNRGYVYSEKGFIEEAIQEFSAVLKLNPSDEMAVRCHFNLGILYNKTNQPKSAIQHFEQANKITPNQFLLHWNLADLYKSMGDFENALTNFKRALEIDPNYRDVYTLYYNIGNAYIKLNQNKQAIEPLLKALEYKPEHDGILTLIAQAHFNLGQYDHTEAYLNRLENLGHPQREFLEKLQNARSVKK